MKSLKRSLLLIALCLAPALTFSAPDSSVASASEVGDDAFEAGSFGVCSEASPGGTAALVEGEAKADAESSQECDALQDGEANEGLSTPLERKPCKAACPNQPWCECTYQGHPRVSCDPCCYQTYAGEICLS